MTRDDFVQRHRHELAGMVLDALAGPKGAEAAVRIRYTMTRIDQLLVEMYDELQHRENDVGGQPVRNGQTPTEKDSGQRQAPGTARAAGPAQPAGAAAPAGQRPPQGRPGNPNDGKAGRPAG